MTAGPADGIARVAHDVDRLCHNMGYVIQGKPEVLRNAVIPAVTVLGINIGYLIGGTLIVEQVFAIPGLGNLMINAIFDRDFTVIQGVALIYGVLVVLVNLLTDVAYVALDPRVRFDA